MAARASGGVVTSKYGVMGTQVLYRVSLCACVLLVCSETVRGQDAKLTGDAASLFQRLGRRVPGVTTYTEPAVGPAQLPVIVNMLLACSSSHAAQVRVQGAIRALGALRLRCNR